MQVIDSFRGEYSFLSNFHKCRVEFEGTVYPSVEHAFQAAKNPDPEYRSLIAAAGSPVTAKRMGKKTQLRSDWEEVKEGIMLELLRSKFSDPALREKLLATGDAELIEGNNHWDRYWGVCRGEGLNKLGKLLMYVRSELREESGMDKPWFDKADIDACSSLDDLFSLWKKAHEAEPDLVYKSYGGDVNKLSFTRDGIIDPAFFGKDKCVPKILLICKEGHEFDDPEGSRYCPEKNLSDGKNFWVADGLSGKVRGREVSAFLNCLAAYCNAYIKKNFEFDRGIHLDRSVLKKAAFMNINKRGGFGSCDDKVLKGYAERYAPFIAKEIALIDPEVIICCGVGLKELVVNTIGVPERCHAVIQAYHPSDYFVGYATKLRKMVEDNTENYGGAENV